MKIINLKENPKQKVPVDFTGKVIHKNGTVCYFKNGAFHRLDGPAIERPDGTKEYWVNGKLHRLDGPACEWFNGYKDYYVEGKRHRLDGPAYEGTNGTKIYFIEGKKHRLDGPACEWFDGTKEYWIDGKYYYKEDFDKLVNEMNKSKTTTCNNKVVEIEGKKYKLVEMC